MTPGNARAQLEPALALTEAEEAIARSVLFAGLFDYPLTLAQLRHTLIGSRQTASEIRATLRDSRTLARLIEERDGFFFPAGRAHLLDTRRHREARSRMFLAAHDHLLRLIASCPYVRLVALSGSIAHLNLDHSGDLDLFIVTRGGHVWSVAVMVVLLAKLLGRRRSLCANFIVSDTDLVFEPRDLFTASQIIGLKPLAGEAVFQEVLDANPFVREHYPNFHAADARGLRMRRSNIEHLKPFIEKVLFVPSALVELVCRGAYRAYLRRRSSTWTSPDQVVLGDRVLKLHTRSHRRDVLDRFEDAVRSALG
jgi:hypothetical protein